MYLAREETFFVGQDTFIDSISSTLQQSKPSKIQIAWNEDGTIASLLINKLVNINIASSIVNHRIRHGWLSRDPFADLP